MFLVNPYIIGTTGGGGGSSIALVGSSVKAVRNEGFNVVGSASSIDLPSFSATSGNLIAVGVSYYYFAHTEDLAVTDTAGNTYTLVATVGGDTGTNLTHVVAILYAKNITGNGSNVINIAFSRSSSPENPPRINAFALQYSGLSTSAPLDQSVATEGSLGSSVTSGSFTTTAADELLFAIAANVSDDVTACVAGTGYTLEDSSVASASNYGIGVEDKIVSSIQTGVTTSMTFTLTNNNYPGIVVATF